MATFWYVPAMKPKHVLGFLSEVYCYSRSNGERCKCDDCQCNSNKFESIERRVRLFSINLKADE